MQLIRITHLLTLICIFPFAAYYLKHAHPEFIRDMTGTSAAFILIGSLFMITFHVMFEVRYFPLDEKGAQKRFLAFAGNIGVSSFVGTQSTFFGSYSACCRIGIMYFVYFGLMTFLFLVKEKRKRFFYYTNNGYIALLLFLFICSTGILFLLLPYYKSQVLSEKNILIIALGVFMLGVDTYLHTKNLLRHNMFQFDTNEDELEAREKVMMTWGIAGFLLVIISYVAVLIISSNNSIT
jgi:hypothetical protein